MFGNHIEIDKPYKFFSANFLNHENVVYEEIYHQYILYTLIQTFRVISIYKKMLLSMLFNTITVDTYYPRYTPATEEFLPFSGSDKHTYRTPWHFCFS